MNDWIIYGANGYTGELIARAAVAAGLRPRLAGRNAAAIRTLANTLGLPFTICRLEDREGLHQALQGAQVVLHCAGPFQETSAPMVEACLQTGVHYLDITGEISVFEAAAKQDAAARRTGVMLMPGVGFDVVPSDCLAAHLARRLPEATSLALAFRTFGSISRGTAITMLTMTTRGCERRNGQLIITPPLHEVRMFDFGRGPQPCVSIPWGDVATAYYTTGIPNIKTFVAIPRRAQRWFSLARQLLPIVQLPTIRAGLRHLLARTLHGPDATTRATGRSIIVGEVTDTTGRCATSRLTCPEGYTLTVQTALLIVQRVLNGHTTAGFHTPAGLYGPDLICEVPGVTRSDE
ncbi:trans-acting enoyl reductase family protein [uncultured Chloroflexus sp.]|uniref:saccharopine dehydrogenase family protein n=1 Tax=uncultured Chloroflexus sp. TaxID=214040 RepID=UPI00263A1D6E|nr:saccharopine dehydrogenase NADP-binding domain-containing protein [uncultured Chloroflexus sp.]